MNESRRAPLLALGFGLLLTGCQLPFEPPQDVSCADCNVLLISIDTLRADHLGAYGYERDVSPQIDRFAARSMVFEEAYSASYHTADAHMSIFTSLYPSVHGIRNARKQDPIRTLSSGIKTLPEALKEGGYKTVGFHGGGNVAPIYGFDRGFDVYQRSSSVDDPIAWMNEHSDEPFFVFYHTYDVHDPYLPPPPFNTMFDPDYDGDIVSDAEQLEQLLTSKDFNEKRDAFWQRVDPQDVRDLEHVRALYDGAIRRTDGEIGRLIEAARAQPRKTVIVLTSDHGEEFYEHGRFLHDQLYNEVLRVPLIIRHPDAKAGKRISQRVSTIDLTPTLLEMLVLPPLAHAQGHSLIPLMASEKATPRPIFSEKAFPPALDARLDEAGPEPAPEKIARNASVILSSNKLVKRQNKPAEFYDLEKDPVERENLADRDLSRLQRFEQILEKFSRTNEDLRLELHRGASDETEELDPETIQQLRALGYL